MNWFRKSKPETPSEAPKDEPLRLVDVKLRWQQDLKIWESLTDAQLAKAWDDASYSEWTERTLLLSWVCGERLRKKHCPRAILSNAILPDLCIFRATHSASAGSLVHVESRQTTHKKKKSRK